jgi:hypothetical protein
MKRLLILLFLLIGISSYAQEEAYQNGDYAGAIALYEARLANGEASGAIYYNLANAYYETGTLGLALFNYRQSEIYLPRDEDIDLQIARLRAEREDLIGEESNWLYITADLSRDLVTVYELSLFVFALWCLFFLLLAWQRHNLRWLFWTSGVALLFGLVFLGSRLYLDNQNPEAVLISEAAQVMTGPSTDYLPLYILYEAAELRIVEQRDDWLRFVLADGRSGWLEISNVKIIAN